MMKDVIILGAGKFAREVYSMILDCIDDGEHWKFKGFLDDRPNILDDFPHEGEMLGAPIDYIPKSGDIVIQALGEPAPREKFVLELLNKGAHFETLIHPTVYRGKNVRIGNGCVIAHCNILTADMRLGDFVNIGAACTLSHGNELEAWVTLGGGCAIAGEVKIGARTSLGCGVLVAPGLHIGEGACIGIGSVVMRNVCGDAFMLGNPAKQIGKASERYML